MTIGSKSNKHIDHWLVACFFCIFPFTALLHNIIFYSHTCILDITGQNDYSLLAIWKWSSIDPSLPIAIILVFVIYCIGKDYNHLQLFIYPIPVAFLLYTLYIWDIPFTGRIICRKFHDGHFLLFTGTPLKVRYLLFFSLLLYFVIEYFMLSKKISKKRNHKFTKSS